MWDDNISGPSASVYEAGREISFISENQDHAGFNQLFSDEGITLTQCFIAADKTGARLLAHQPSEIERADYICRSLSKKLEAMKARFMGNASSDAQPGMDQQNEELYKAVNSGLIEQVIELLDEGMSPDTRDAYGMPRWLALLVRAIRR